MSKLTVTIPRYGMVFPSVRKNTKQHAIMTHAIQHMDALLKKEHDINPLAAGGEEGTEPGKYYASQD